MSKFDQIERKLIAMGPGEFQKMCDVLITKKYLSPVRSEGSKKGENKVRSGTPDGFIFLDNGNFIFNEYTTTERKKVKAKFIEDLKEKCFNSDKTGIPISKIEKVILGYNSQLSPRDMNELHELGIRHEVAVEFFDLTELKYALYDYPKLAEDFLGITPDTKQILQPTDFIADIEHKGTSQTQPCLGRENEIQALKKAFETKKIVLLTGPAGVGKTKIAIEFLKQYVKNNPTYIPYGILTKGQPIYFDLKAYFTKDKAYIIIVDDANRIGDLFSILSLAGDRQIAIKIIITVRDYAQGPVLDALKIENYSFETILLDRLPDDIIKSLLAQQEVTNSMCVEKILDIAQGNPRLAMMATDFVKRKKNCNSLNNIADIYESFFGNLLAENKLGKNNDAKVLGIVSFFRIIERRNKDLCQRIYDQFAIAENDFWESVSHLHAHEFVNLYELQIVKISDQVVATYFFYDIWLKKSLLSLYDLLKEFANEYPGKIKESLYPILNHFGHETIVSLITPDLEKRMQDIASDKDALLVFHELFFFFNPAATLRYVQEQIALMPNSAQKEVVYRIQEERTWIDFDGQNAEFKILKLYGQSPNIHFETSLELLFTYIQKNLEHLPRLIRYFENGLLFGQEDFNQRYWRQTTLFSYLYARIKESKDNITVRILIEIAPKFLQTVFRYTHSGRQPNTVSFVTTPLHPTKEIATFRKNLLCNLFSNFLTHEEQIMKALTKYVNNSYHKEVKEINEADFNIISPLIQQYMSPSNFLHTKWVHDYCNRLALYNIQIPELDILKKKFTSDSQALFLQLTYGYIDWREGNLDAPHDDFIQFKKQKITDFFLNYKMDDFLALIPKFQEFGNIENVNRENINTSIACIVLNIINENTDNGVSFLRELFETGNPTQFYSFEVIKQLLIQLNPKDVYKLISSIEFKNQFSWRFNFFHALNEVQLNELFIASYLKTLEGYPKHAYLHFDNLPLLKRVEPKIYEKVTTILIEKIMAFKKAPKFNYAALFSTFIEEQKSELTLMQRLYSQCTLYSSRPFDRKGEIFQRIYKIDQNFFSNFIEWLSKTKPYITDSSLEFNFAYIWGIDKAEEIIESASATILKDHQYSGAEFIAAKFFPKNSMPERIEQYLMTLLETYIDDEIRLYTIFTIVRKCYPDRLLGILEAFLQRNTDIENFVRLPLVSSSYSVSSPDGVTNRYQRILEFWESVIPLVSGKAKLLEHLQYVSDKIRSNRHVIQERIEDKFRGDY